MLRTLAPAHAAVARAVSVPAGRGFAVRPGDEREAAGSRERSSGGAGHDLSRIRIGRAPGAAQSAGGPALQAKFAGAAAHPPAPAVAGGGRPLPGGVRERMERSFGQDFSRVRVHEGPQADALGAIAYTRGQALHFAPGRFSPHSHEGRRLLAHELAHVVQQRAGRVAVPQGKGAPINDNQDLEAEADRAAADAARGERVRVALARGPSPAGGAGSSAKGPGCGAAAGCGCPSCAGGGGSPVPPHGERSAVPGALLTGAVQRKCPECNKAKGHAASCSKFKAPVAKSKTKDWGAIFHRITKGHHGASGGKVAIAQQNAASRRAFEERKGP